MSRLQVRAIIILATCVASNAFGQDDEDCLGVLALSKTISTTMSDKESLEAAASDFCNEYSKHSGSSSSMNMGASYGVLSASFGSSNASAESIASRYCSKSDSSKMAKDAYRQYIEAISPQAYPAYQSCIEMKNNSLTFRLQGLNPKQFVMTVAFRPDNAPDTIAELAVKPSDGITCNWGLTAQTQTLPLKGGTATTLDCKRTNQSQPGFVTVLRVNGTKGTVTVPWQAYTPDNVPVNTISELKASIESLKTSVAEKQQKDQWPVGDYVILAGSGGCPTGFNRVETSLVGLVQYYDPAQTDKYTNYITVGEFGSSFVRVHGRPGSMATGNAAFQGALKIVACVKTK